jgi:hypothetical protein
LDETLLICYLEASFGSFEVTNDEILVFGLSGCRHNIPREGRSNSLRCHKLYWRPNFRIIGFFFTLIVFIVTHNVIPIDSYYRFVEFITLWTFVAQLAAIFSLGAWRVFWNRYAFVQQKP